MSPIIELMKAMGYEDVSEGGVCFGLAHGLIQAYLTGEKDWVEIHKMLASLQPGQIKKLVGVVMGIDADGSMYGDTGAIKKAEERKEKGESNTISVEYGLPEEFTDEKLSKVRAFLETVYMYHQGYEKENEFTDTKTVNQHSQDDLYIDKLLEQEKARTARVCCHNQENFTRLLQSMEKVEGPVGFEIGLTEHAMGLVYNGDENWTLVDHDRCIEGDINLISNYIYNTWRKSKDFFNDGDEKSIMYTLIVYANPERKSEIEKCKEIMDREQLFNDAQMRERLKSSDLLLRAAWSGDVKTTQACIQANFDINAKDEYGFTALIRAAKKGHTKIVKELLSLPGLDINAKDNDGFTALMRAAYNGHTKIVKELLSLTELDINAKNNGGMTALMWAANKGHIDIVEAILAHPEVNINAKNNIGQTELMAAAENGKLEAVKVILAHPDVNINAKNNFGPTALMFEVCKGNLEAVKAINNIGHTALMYAAQRGDLEVIKAILAHPEVNINAKNHFGHTALMLAACIGHTEIANLLIERGSDINAKNNIGQTALMVAADNGKLEAVKAILAHPEVNTNAKHKYGHTALMWAAERGHVEVVKAILDHKEGETHTVSVDQAIEATLGAKQKGNDGIAEMIRHHRNIPDRKIELYKEIKELERKVKKKVLSNKVKSHSFVALCAISAAAGVYYRFGTGL